MIEYEIDIPEKLRKLNLAANYVRARSRHLEPAMRKSVSVAHAAVTRLVPVGATGEAKRSISSQVLAGPYQIVGKVQSTMRRPNVYIFVLNSGRPPGKRMTNSTKLEPWVQSKGLASSPERVRQIAFLIARAVQRKGTRGLGIFYNGLERTKRMIETIHSQAIEAMTRELGDNA